MIMEGCQARPRTPTLTIKQCPRCGAELELFSVDTEVVCERCRFVAYNDALSCVQWCQYARRCVGDEMYENLMAVAASQKRRREENRNASENH